MRCTTTAFAPQFARLQTSYQRQDVSAPQETSPRPAAAEGDSVSLSPQALELRTRSAEAPRVSDGPGDAAAARGTDPAARREAFIHGMEEAGVHASTPPTPAQLRQYFGTFNNPEHRSEAPARFEEYASAFHVHEASSESPGDVEYGRPRTSYVVGDEVYRSEAEANRAARSSGEERVEVPISTARSWDDVNSRPSGRDGRQIQDCEGFAFMAGDLLHSAGYETTQITGEGARGGHAMVLAEDPNSDDVVVTSNSHAYRGTDADATLDAGWTGQTRTAPPRTYYEGATQEEAQALLAADR